MGKLVDNMISHLNEMSTKSKLLFEEKWASVFKELNCKEQEWKDLLDKCEEYFKYDDHNLTKLDDNTLDSLSREYDKQSQCIMYKTSTITNFGVYTTARKRLIVKSCKYAIESVKSLKVKFQQYTSRMPVLGFL